MGHKYTTIHMNVRSLPSKYDQIRSMMAKLTEIWITVHLSNVKHFCLTINISVLTININ